MGIETTLSDAILSRPAGYALRSTKKSSLKGLTRLRRSVPYMEHASLVIRDYLMHSYLQSYN